MTLAFTGPYFFKKILRWHIIYIFVIKMISALAIIFPDVHEKEPFHKNICFSNIGCLLPLVDIQQYKYNIVWTMEQLRSHRVPSSWIRWILCCLKSKVYDHKLFHLVELHYTEFVLNWAKLNCPGICHGNYVV